MPKKTKLKMKYIVYSARDREEKLPFKAWSAATAAATKMSLRTQTAHVIDVYDGETFVGRMEIRADWVGRNPDWTGWVAVPKPKKKRRVR